MLTSEINVSCQLPQTDGNTCLRWWLLNFNVQDAFCDGAQRFVTRDKEAATTFTLSAVGDVFEFLQ